MSMHSRFAEYQYLNRKDWFHIDFDILRKGLDDLQLYMDGKRAESTFDEETFNACSVINDKATI